MSSVASMVQTGVHETYAQPLEQQERVEKETAHSPETNRLSSAAVRDEYVSGQETPSAGVYRPSADDNGSANFIFDKPDEQNVKTAPEKAEDEERQGIVCTVNTDQVDAEMKELKNEAVKLEQEIAQAADDPEKAEMLQNQLQQIQREISMKDNDSYRRQHAEFSYSDAK